MASSRPTYLEESRPPESSVKRRRSDNAQYNYKYFPNSSPPTFPRKQSSIGSLSLPSDISLIETNEFVLTDIPDQNFNPRQPDNLISNLNSEETIIRKNNLNFAHGDVNSNNFSLSCNTKQYDKPAISPRRVMKSNSCRETCADRTQMSSKTKRPALMPPEQCRKRSSYHCDVEEALSSLLWQPYEYRSTRSDSSDTLSSTLSSASSSVSLAQNSAARSLMQSFTDEFLNVTTSLPAQRHSGNNADPNLSSQMVTNLMALKSTTVGAPIAQYERAARSRGSDGGSAASQVDWERSRECAFVTWSACNVCNPATTITTTAATNSYPGRIPCDSVDNIVLSYVRDDTVLSAVSDMRVEIPGPVSQPSIQEVANRKPPDVLQHSGTQVSFPQSVHSAVQIDRNTQGSHHHNRQHVMGSGVVSVGTSSDSRISSGVVSVGENTTRAVYLQPNARCSVSISSDMIPSNITSVVSANVVGLPVHTRSSSNLSSGRPDTLQPNHPRSVSETVNSVFVQHQLGTHFRSSSNLASMPSTPQSQHQDRNSHCGLIPVPSHPRQSSSGSLTQTRGSSEPPINIMHSSDVHKVSSSSEQRSSLVPNASANDLNLVQSSYIRNPDLRTLSVEDVVQSNRVPPLPNVSNVNVNFYRAVPVNVVSSVPTIHCLNSVEDSGNNVSNVHIVQAMPTAIPSVSIAQTATEVPVQQTAAAPSFEVRTRTFTSTEAQTDDTAVGALVSPTAAANTVSSSREQRRRERRERRHQRRLNSTNHQHAQQGQPWPPGPNDRLPDLLNSHLPPPYTTLPSSLSQNPIQTTIVPPNNLMPATVVTSPVVPNNIVPFHPGLVPGQVPLVPGPPPVPIPTPTGFRFPFPSAAGFRRCRSRLGPRYTEEQPKSCCGLLVSRPGSLRWFIALIALVAVCCVLVGTVLGAMRPAGRDHLTVSLLMIGVGIVLVTVSGVAWRLTSHDAPSCRAMLGLESSETADICTRRFVPRLPPSYGRPHHPYAAMIYPEFQYRPPPPSYQASMQEYRLRLLLLDRGTAPQTQGGAQHAVSPPPTYRSHAGSLLRVPLSSRRDAAQSEYSCPPSYRSRTSSNRPGNETIIHSREQSLTLSESNHGDSVVNVVNILTNQEETITLDNMALDSLKLGPENENLTPLRMILKSSSENDLVETSTKDGNLVTIVQKADQNPVIVTVSGSQMSTTNPEVGSSNQIPSEMEILAHL